MGMIVDALAPTNFAASNPAAIRKAFETEGESLRRGLDNFLDDLAANGGKPRQVDASSFELGVNLAATPGKVVFRNDLMELIQYSPRTETVHEVPLLLSPPWINKYYVMDLAPGRSFVEWAVDHGHTTFAISWRNPRRRSMREPTTLDDYLLQGLATAVDVVRQICGVPQVNIAGLCVGGTLAVMLLAWLAQAAEDDGEADASAFRHPPQHPGRLQRAGRPGRLHRPRRHRAPRGADGRAGLPGRGGDGGHVRRPAAQRPHLELRGRQLAHGPDPARLRHPGVERRRHPHPGRHPLAVPAQLLPREPPGHGPDDHRRPAPAASTTSSPTSTSSPPARTTSPRGSRRTPPSASSPPPSASCSARPATSPASSTRPVPSGSTGPTTTCPLDPDAWRAAATEHPGTWWERLGRMDRRPGRRPATPAPHRQRPPTPPSTTHPAPT